MVIKRNVGQSVAVDTPERRSLGRLVMNIDDLKVLMELLGSNPFGSEQICKAPVVVQYDGGVFTDADDMRQLSDEDLRDLRVRSGSTTVFLSRSRAQVFGPRAMNDLVALRWVGARGLKKSILWPRKREALMALAVTIFGVLFGVTLGTLGDVVSNSAQVVPQETSSIEISISGTVTLVAASFFAWLIFAACLTVVTNFAVIVPFTVDELRKTETLPK